MRSNNNTKSDSEKVLVRHYLRHFRSRFTWELTPAIDQ